MAAHQDCLIFRDLHPSSLQVVHSSREMFPACADGCSDWFLDLRALHKQVKPALLVPIIKTSSMLFEHAPYHRLARRFCHEVLLSGFLVIYRIGKVMALHNIQTIPVLSGKPRQSKLSLFEDVEPV